MAQVTLISGGARSGKSHFAQEKALEYNGKRLFIATAVAIDTEMEERIAKHREERGGRFVTVEAPYDIAGALQKLSAETEIACIDCLTVWLGNLFHRHENYNGEIDKSINELVNMLHAPPCDLLLVTNEVGSGIVPEVAPARQFRDMAGTLNRRVAEAADHVYLCVCGIPVVVK